MRPVQLEETVLGNHRLAIHLLKHETLSPEQAWLHVGTPRSSPIILTINWQASANQFIPGRGYRRCLSLSLDGTIPYRCSSYDVQAIIFRSIE